MAEIANETTTLINFRAKKELIDTFDKLCRFNGFTRTSVLLSLIRRFVAAEIPKVEQSIKSRQKLDKTLEETNFDSSLDGPPSFISTSEFERELWDDETDNF